MAICVFVVIFFYVLEINFLLFFVFLVFGHEGRRFGFVMSLYIFGIDLWELLVDMLHSLRARIMFAYGGLEVAWILGIYR